MATKVTVIDIDLGISIDDIITKGVTEIAGNVRHELDIAIDTAKTVKRLKEAKEQAVKNTDNAIQGAMEAAYDALAKTGDIGLPVSAVMALVDKFIPTTSAFTTRMKHFLKGKGSPYVLGRVKQHSVPFYVFLPYNKQD